jgi:glycosyltransferase involved in cell wall biosynthesis
MAKCSIIIRCYNEEEHIGRLLNGIAQQTLKGPEIIVVDSGSDDNTLAIVARHPVRVVSVSPEQFSFGRALNLGCRLASGDFLVFASAHVYPLRTDWLETLLQPFTDSDVACTYGKQRGNETTTFSERRIFEQWFPEDANPQQDHPFCNNANAAVRRSLWEQLPYDETLTGLEDIDWGKRVMRIGHRIAYASDAEIVHVHNETAERVFNRYRREALALKQISPHEKFTLWDLLSLWSTNIIGDLRQARRERVLRQHWQQILVFRAMQFLGTYRGFAQHGRLTSHLKRRLYYPSVAPKPQRPAEQCTEGSTIDYAMLTQDPPVDERQ